MILIMLALGVSGCKGFNALADRKWTKVSLESGPDIKVRILRKKVFTRATFEWPEGGIEIRDHQGHEIPWPPGARRVYLRQRGDQVALAFKPGRTVAKKAPKYPSLGFHSADNHIGIAKLHVPEIRFRRQYEGREFQIAVKRGRLALINTLPLEMYLSRVLPAEMAPNHFTLEALKAQAVVARTWALKNLRRHQRYGYNFCDAPHCQVYQGRKDISLRCERAVKMTKGEVLVYQGRLAEAFYHSTCGGNTAFVDEVWKSRPQPYLARVEDHWKSGYRPYCARSPYARWKARLSLRRLEQAMRENHTLGQEEKLEQVEVDFLDRSGHVKRILITTNQRQYRVPGPKFRSLVNRIFVQHRILSSFYDLKIQGNKLAIQGRGLGHAVGMCQWGARGMAQHGFTYKEILDHYFKGTEVKNRDDMNGAEAGATVSTTEKKPAGIF